MNKTRTFSQVHPRPDMEKRQRTNWSSLTTSALALTIATSAIAQDKPQQPIGAPQGLGVWLVGVHPMAHDPSEQWVAHHFCQQLQPDLMQCALYSGNQPDAKLTGGLGATLVGQHSIH